MENMTKKQLEKIISKAKVDTVKHGENDHYSVVIEGFNREINLPTKDADEAKEKALELIISEPPHIRGFSLDTDKE